MWIKDTALLIRRDGTVTCTEVNSHMHATGWWTTCELDPPQEEPVSIADSLETQPPLKGRTRTFLHRSTFKADRARMWFFYEQ